MKIRDTIFNCSLQDVLDELITQLKLNNYQYLEKGYKRSGDSLQVQCPFHGNGQEQHPSYGLRMSDGMGHCFACGCVHDLPEFISACFEKYDVMATFGWNWLKKNFLTFEIEQRKKIELPDFDRKKKVETKQYVSEEELDSYRYFHPYMYKRKLTDEIIEMFDVGYDKKTDCLTFPVRDIDGNCLFVARRSVKIKFFNYPKGVEKPLYGIYELYQQQDSYKSIIICESILDALTCWVYGKPAVALNGVESELQIKQLKQFPCREYILATDNDNAGMKARKRIAGQITNKILRQYILPKDRKDINELTEAEFQNLPVKFVFST